MCVHFAIHLHGNWHGQRYTSEYLQKVSKHIQQAIEELPPSYREAFIMHRFRNLSYKEIAEILDVSPKTVDYRIQQSLKILRVKLQDYLPVLLLLLTAKPAPFN